MLPNPNVENLPIGINAVVEALRPYLLNVMYTYQDGNGNLVDLPFYEDAQIFGIAEKDEMDGNPIIKKEGNDYHNLLPNDQKRCVAFFYEHDNRQVNHDLYTFDISLLVWFNHNLLIPNASPATQLTELFISKTLNELRKAVSWQEQNFQVIKGKDNIYSDFKLEERTKPIMKFPYDAFRIRFKFSKRIFCKYELPIFIFEQDMINFKRHTFNSPLGQTTESIDLSTDFPTFNKPFIVYLQKNTSANIFESVLLGVDGTIGSGFSTTPVNAATCTINEGANTFELTGLQNAATDYQLLVLQLG